MSPKTEQVIEPKPRKTYKRPDQDSAVGHLLGLWRQYKTIRDDAAVKVHDYELALDALGVDLAEEE